ncbi:MAG TPA: ferritin family protein [Spirochaetota bacterium]
MVIRTLHGIQLLPRDILEFSILMEERIYHLYENFATVVKDPKTKEIFSLFADEKYKHKGVFQKLLTGSSKEIYESSADPEHIEFLTAQINSTIFSKKFMIEKLKRIRDPESSFEFLISIELDQILFYSEIRDLFIEEHKYLLDEIIDEKRRHFVRVMQIKQMKGY